MGNSFGKSEPKSSPVRIVSVPSRRSAPSSSSSRTTASADRANAFVSTSVADAHAVKRPHRRQQVIEEDPDAQPSPLEGMRLLGQHEECSEDTLREQSASTDVDRCVVAFQNNSKFPVRVCIAGVRSVSKGSAKPVMAEFLLMPHVSRPVIVQNIYRVIAIETNQGWQRASMNLDGSFFDNCGDPSELTAEEKEEDARGSPLKRRGDSAKFRAIRVTLTSGVFLDGVIDRSAHLVHVHGFGKISSIRHEGTTDSELRRRLVSLRCSRRDTTSSVLQKVPEQPSVF
eukprot:ANDGO_05447.mRNA.1 hypothetical protein